MTDTPAPLKNLYAPRQWPTWLGFALVWLIVRLPLGWVLAISRGLGRLLYHLARRRRRIAEINIKLCFPDDSEAKRTQLVRDHFAAMVMGIFEMGMAWWLPDARLEKLITVKGREHLEKALAKGKGVLLLSGHFTSLELAGRLYSMSIPHPWSGMYRPHENPVIEFFFRRDRTTFFSDLIPRDDVRSFIKKLRRGETAWFAPDQNYRKKGYIMAPFFGTPAPTQPATSRLIKMSGAAAMPFEYRRLPGSEGYLLEFYPPLEDFPSDDEVANATRINQVFETLIRHAPEQYFWLHRRFKLPRGEPGDVYHQHNISGN
ncbi:MAG TPA: LpxL/LpxP family Kdo(2)-lipid IV(A) lauroyl/palmitoleoyl acyltransferase [Candidatus Tenderia sp.]|nr:LpxL/LpxP family Kdo(2)-lipid IV(A) lauroyl/palmitoleoyl acyltransferase [Candidatus Tenderia sp.]